MRLIVLALATTVLTAPLAAEQTGTSPDPVSPAAAAGQPPPKDSELPVSLDRIREGLARPAPGTALKNLELRADFMIHIEEQDHLRAILSKLDFAGGPAPGGGLYAYEQQQRAFSKTERPLQQPYAAFSGGELLTLALESLVQKYLGGALVNAVTGAQRSSAERAARTEVATAIAAYCDAQPDGGRAIHLCQDLIDR